MILLVVGGLLVGVAAGLDFFFRVRMQRVGEKWALLQGGAFDYSRYHRIRKQQGWSGWPVFVIWAAIVAGIALLIAGFFSYFGTGSLRGT
jgi:hypothetical protein